MFRSIRLGRLWGIDVFVHFTFLLFLLYFGWQEWDVAKAEGLSDHDAFHSAANVVALICGIFCCVVLHEYGHALTARRFGIGTVDITLLPIGGVARLERIPEKPMQELIVAVMGPAVNVVIIVVLLAMFGVSHFLNWDRFAKHQGEWMHGLNVWGGFFKNILWANVAMVVFNLIPAFPMDGGRVLRALLAMRIGRVRATQIAAGIGKVLAVGLAVWGFSKHQYLLLFTATFVWIGASQEAASVRYQAQRLPDES